MNLFCIVFGFHYLCTHVCACGGIGRRARLTCQAHTFLTLTCTQVLSPLRYESGKAERESCQAHTFSFTTNYSNFTNCDISQFDNIQFLPRISRLSLFVSLKEKGCWLIVFVCN